MTLSNAIMESRWMTSLACHSTALQEPATERALERNSLKQPAAARSIHDSPGQWIGAEGERMSAGTLPHVDDG